MLRKWNHMKCSFIHNCPNLEATKMPLSRRMDPWAVVHPDKYSVSNTDELHQAVNRHGGSLRAYSLLREEANGEGYLLHDSSNLTF